jgi:flagellar motor switch protein FliM
MSGQVLSPDAIAALVEAAKDGQLPDESGLDRGRQRRLRTVDFTRPTKFTTDQERRIKRALETFCRTASTRLSAELRMPLELEVINASQLTWGNAHAQVPPRSVSCLVDVQDAPTRMLLGAEMNLVVAAIDLLLGGTGTATTAADRRLTDIDWHSPGTSSSGCSRSSRSSGPTSPASSWRSADSTCTRRWRP